MKLQFLRNSPYCIRHMIQMQQRTCSSIPIRHPAHRAGRLNPCGSDNRHVNKNSDDPQGKPCSSYHPSSAGMLPDTGRSSGSHVSVFYTFPNFFSGYYKNTILRKDFRAYGNGNCAGLPPVFPIKQHLLYLNPLYILCLSWFTLLSALYHHCRSFAMVKFSCGLGPALSFPLWSCSHTILILQLCLSHFCLRDILWRRKQPASLPGLQAVSVTAISYGYIRLIHPVQIP